MVRCDETGSRAADMHGEQGCLDRQAPLVGGRGSPCFGLVGHSTTDRSGHSHQCRSYGRRECLSFPLLFLFLSFSLSFLFLFPFVSFSFYVSPLSLSVSFSFFYPFFSPFFLSSFLFSPYPFFFIFLVSSCLFYLVISYSEPTTPRSRWCRKARPRRRAPEDSSQAGSQAPNRGAGGWPHW